METQVKGPFEIGPGQRAALQAEGAIVGREPFGSAADADLRKWIAEA